MLVTLNTSPSPSPFRARLSDLQRRYAARLPEHVRSIETLVDRWCENRHEDDWHALDRCVHNLIGTGGTYGLDEVSGVARLVARDLYALRSHLTPCAQMLDPSLAELRRVVAHTAARF
ncbi:MAG: Hpt domain-containing protein [Acidobacteriota bacterium]